MRGSRSVTLFGIGCLLLTACGWFNGGSSSRPTAPSVTPLPSPRNCRTFATAWVATPTFGSAQNVVAAYNATSHVYQETIAGTNLLLRQSTYASTSDFVDEPGVLGRVLYLQTAACSTTAGCQTLGEIEMPTYDNSRRRIGSVVRVNGVPLIVDTYLQWDSLGRPTSGERAQAGVCAVPYSLAYDDGTRTVTEGAQAGGSILCAVASTSRVRTYDADGNVLTETGAAGGTSTTVSNAIQTVQQICK